MRGRKALRDLSVAQGEKFPAQPGGAAGWGRRISAAVSGGWGGSGKIRAACDRARSTTQSAARPFGKMAVHRARPWLLTRIRFRQLTDFKLHEKRWWRRRHAIHEMPVVQSPSHQQAPRKSGSGTHIITRGSSPLDPAATNSRLVLTFPLN